jgi:uncharacterized protein YkwD
MPQEAPGTDHLGMSTSLRSLLRLRTQLRVLILACVVTVSVPAVPALACAGENLIPDAQNAPAVRAATLCLLNQQRAADHERPLRANPALQAAAQRYAGTMVAGRFFAHVSPTGSTLDQRIRQGTSYLRRALSWQIGENIAWGSGTRARPLDTVAAWMASPPHRANILRGSFREIGIGVAPGAPVPGFDAAGAATYANAFGARH